MQTKSFDRPSYAVKYLGVVDGSMGILSRTMALQNTFLDDPSKAPVKKAKCFYGRKASHVVNSDIDSL